MADENIFYITPPSSYTDAMNKIKSDPEKLRALQEEDREIRISVVGNPEVDEIADLMVKSDDGRIERLFSLFHQDMLDATERSEVNEYRVQMYNLLLEAARSTGVFGELEERGILDGVEKFVNPYLSIPPLSKAALFTFNNLRNAYFGQDCQK